MHTFQNDLLRDKINGWRNQLRELLGGYNERWRGQREEREGGDRRVDERGVGGGKGEGGTEGEEEGRKMGEGEGEINWGILTENVQT